MNNLDNSERSEWDENWKDVFEEASVKPSSKVWNKIDGVLANRESGLYKKRAFFYKSLAAASVALLLLTGALSYYFIDQSFSNQMVGKEPNGSSDLSSQEMAQKQVPVLPDKPVERAIIPADSTYDGEASSIYALEDGLDNRPSEALKLPEAASAKIEESVENKGGNNILSDDGREQLADFQKLEVLSENKETFVMQSQDKAKPTDNDDAVLEKSGSGFIIDNIGRGEVAPLDIRDALANIINDNPGEKGDIGKENRNISKEMGSVNLLVQSIEAIDFDLKLAAPDWEAYRMYHVPVVPAKKREENDAAKTVLFAGLNFGPGYFDPNIKANSTSNFANANFSSEDAAWLSNTQSQESDMTSGSSFAFGFDIGLRVKERWVIESGLQYLVNNSGATSNVIVEDQSLNQKALYVTTLNLADFSNSTITPSSPISLNNNFQFASIPLKVGYIVLNKKLSIMVSSGVSSEIFLKNEVTDESSRLASVTITPGDESPYNNVYFNGLASARFSYNFSPNYSFSLEPTYRTAISSFSKEDSNFTSTPQAVGVTAGLKFFFR